MTTKMMKIKLIILVGVLLTVSFGLKAQEEGVVIDKVVAVVGGNIILKSDLESQIVSLRAQGAVTSAST